MPRLSDLRTSIRDMSPEELRQKLLAIRKDRRIPKEGAKRRKAVVKAKVKTATKVQKALSGMSVEEQIALLESVEGKP